MNFSFLRKKTKENTDNHKLSNIIYRAISASDLGIVRKSNEDRVFLPGKEHSESLQIVGFLGIVADGMGGHEGGEIASQMAIDIISDFIYSKKYSPEIGLDKAFKIANDEIFKFGSDVSKFSQMGTTCTAVILDQSNLYLAHVGDSRAYLVNQKSITRLTQDHTLVQEMLDHKIISKEEARNHRQRNIITKAMGSSKTITPQIKFHKSLLQEEDLIFLCTDGLHEYVKDDEIKSILLSQSMQKASKTLVNLAIERGGHDNISLVIIGREIAPSRSKKSDI